MNMIKSKNTQNNRNFFNMINSIFNGKFYAIAVFFTLFLFSCAHTEAERRIDAKLAKEEAVHSVDDLRIEANLLIDTIPGLTQDQRSDLRALRDSIKKKNDEISTLSLKLRSLLIKNLISSDYDSEEVSLIKARIQHLENKKIASLFDAVEKTNLILGHSTPENEQMVRIFFGDNK